MAKFSEDYARKMAIEVLIFLRLVEKITFIILVANRPFGPPKHNYFRDYYIENDFINSVIIDQYNETLGEIKFPISYLWADIDDVIMMESLKA